MSRLNAFFDSRRTFLIGSLLWLPAGILLTTFIRFADAFASPTMWFGMLANLGSLIIVAPCGLPLALACRQLWRNGYRQAAWACMIGLGVLTVGATLVAGLLGPVAIVVYALILSLPVWIAVAIVSYLQRRRARPGV